MSGEWQPIETLPRTGQALVIYDGPDELAEQGGYECIELVNLPMTAEGRVLNQNSGNYTKPGVWKWWRPVPSPRFAGRQ